MTYNQIDRSNSVNVLKLREFFWIFHLEDWNFEDEEGKKSNSNTTRAVLYQINHSKFFTVFRQAFLMLLRGFMNAASISPKQRIQIKYAV